MSAFAQKAPYDAALARKLEGNNNGMKTYVLVMLKTGSFDPGDKKLRDSLFMGHMSNMNRLAKENKLFVAGPLGKNDQQYRGVFILNVKTIEEAKLLVATDPAVKANIFSADYFIWFSSAALGEIPVLHERITKD